jgi:hypothetical protein
MSGWHLYSLSLAREKLFFGMRNEFIVGIQTYFTLKCRFKLCFKGRKAKLRRNSVSMKHILYYFLVHHGHVLAGSNKYYRT